MYIILVIDLLLATIIDILLFLILKEIYKNN